MATNSSLLEERQLCQEPENIRLEETSVGLQGLGSSHMILDFAQGYEEIFGEWGHQTGMLGAEEPWQQKSIMLCYEQVLGYWSNRLSYSMLRNSTSRAAAANLRFQYGEVAIAVALYTLSLKVHHVTQPEVERLLRPVGRRILDASGLPRAFADEVSGMPSVRSVLLMRKETSLNIWTILDREPENWETRQRIYAIEQKVLDMFPGARVDFRLINVSEYPDPEAVHMPEGEVIYQRK